MRHLLFAVVLLSGPVCSVEPPTTDKPATATATPLASESLFTAMNIVQPSECVLIPSRPDLVCIDQYVLECLNRCTGGPPTCIPPTLNSCLIDAELNCPPIPPVTEQTRCGDCQRWPDRLVSCVNEQGESVPIPCNAGLRQYYESIGYQCGACKLMPPGQYKVCQCGGEVWRQYCPDETLPEPPEEPEPDPCLIDPILCGKTQPD